MASVEEAWVCSTCGELGSWVPASREVLKPDGRVVFWRKWRSTRHETTSPPFGRRLFTPQARHILINPHHSTGRRLSEHNWADITSRAMFVRDIVERPTAKPTEPTAAPQPPRPPVAGQSKHGFPLAPHRSARAGGGSAFSRARKDDSVRRGGGLVAGEGRVVESVPIVQTAQTASLPPAHDGTLSEAEQVQRSVDAENRQRVAAMSHAEREQEAGEIKERFGADVVELMHKRRAVREAKAAVSASTGRAPAEAPPSEFPGKVFGPSLDAPQPDAAKIRSEVDSENREKVEAMSPSQRSEEVQDLEERFGADLLARLRARAQKRTAKPADTPAAEPESKPTPIGG